MAKGSAFGAACREESKMKPDFMIQRKFMVQQLAKRGITDPLVLEAMLAVPREEFLPESLRASAYDDAPLQGSGDNPFSQPYLVARMIAALELKGGEIALEIGTGAGYRAAVLSYIAKEVYTVERVAQRAEKAATALIQRGFRNVHVLHADGIQGWPDHAPFDAILVAAGSPAIPKALESQLRIGGRLVIPIGRKQEVEEFACITRLAEDEFKRESVCSFRAGAGDHWRPA